MNLLETQIINEMTSLLYNFLPGSGNNRHSFLIAAQKAGVADFWVAGSKRPAVMQLLQTTLDARRYKFCPLILSIVQLGLPWRTQNSESGSGEPLTVKEIDDLNALLLRLQFKIPELHDAGFRTALAGAKAPPHPASVKPGQVQMDALARELVALSDFAPTPRGFAFEKFLSEAFALFDLAPRGSFRLVGEQIDGSFHLDGETYLLEAKWQGPKIGNRELQSFAGSVHAKSAWTRGLFVSYSGFSDDGLEAFARGNATRIICMEGHELWQTMQHHLDLAEVLARKARRAAETGSAFTPVRLLYCL
jgi:hypothetical protein